MSIHYSSPSASHDLIPLSDPERWNATLARVRHGFAHTHRYVQAFALSSGLPTFLYHCRSEGEDVICALSERAYGGHADVLTPFGFGGFSSNGPVPGFGARWHDFARSRGWVCGYLQSNPLLFDPLLAEEPGLSSNSIFVLDLRHGDDELLARMARGRRRQIPRLGSDGVVYGVAGLDAVEFVAKEAPDFFSSRSAAELYQFSEDTWRQLLVAPGILTLEARRNDQLVAVTIFGLAGQMADHLFYILSADGREASTGLLWTGIKELRALGCMTLNLGGGIRPDDDVAKFKRLWGAAELPFAAVRQVFRPELFEELCRQSGVDTRSAYFPPYHAPKRS